MEQWKIQRDRSRESLPCCAQAQEYFAILELPSCLRFDLCATCFHRLERDSDRKPIFWKARRKPAAKRAPTLDLTSLRMLFERLGEDEVDETGRGLRYFVALLLLRKRVLRMVDPVDEVEERADLVVIDPKRKADAGGQPPRVALFAPELDSDRLAGLKDELLAALGEEVPVEAEGSS